MLSNAYFLAKFRFDTAENEPAKNLQNFANFPNFANFANPNPQKARHPCSPPALASPAQTTSHPQACGTVARATVVALRDLAVASADTTGLLLVLFF